MELKLYRVREVAARLNVSAGCVYALVESGKLSSHRIGCGRGVIRISHEAIEEYLERSRTKYSEAVAQPRPPHPSLKHLRI